MPLAPPACPHAVQDGPLVVAAAVAALVGLVGFLSPCVLPLVPGYLSYVAGLSGSAVSESVIAEPDAAERGSGGGGLGRRPRSGVERRMVLGAVLFVVGFSIIFIAQGVLFGSFGAAIRDHKLTIE